MFNRPRVLRIGIASRERIQARTMEIVRGELHPKADDPKIWFTSLESLAQVLSIRNQSLLELIARAKPGSMKELAVLSGRQASNLSRTVRTMERYGLVRIREAGPKRIPEVLYDRIELDLDLTKGSPAARRTRLKRLEAAE